MKLSFCTTCCNRLSQLRQVFDSNSEIVRENPDVEWIIVNFGSKDGLDDFMRERLTRVSNRIVYAREKSGRPWHLSVAKNVAHRLGGGSILVNLDCDNLIGNAVEEIRRCHAAGAEIVHMWSGTRGDGTCGRLAITKERFNALGGYDESLYPMGYQDWDLLRRAIAAGAHGIRVPCAPELALKNTKEESVRFCKRDGLSWEDFNRLNRKQSMTNIAAGRLFANQPHGWASLNVEIVARGNRTAPPSADAAVCPPTAMQESTSGPNARARRSLLTVACDFLHSRRQRRINRKKTVLLAWELGRGMGHIQRLLPIATELDRLGYTIAFAFRSQTDAAAVWRSFPKARILPAPVH